MLRVRKLFRQRIHFLLQGRLVFHQPDPGVPSVRDVPVGILDFFPGTGMLLLKICHECLNIRRHAQLGMHRGKKQNVRANFAVLGILIVNLAVRCQERHKIDEHQSDGDHRPASALHVFVSQGNEHCPTPYIASQV